MEIKEGMSWPPINSLINWKMMEHSAWYSGDATVLANFYNDYYSSNALNVPYQVNTDESFWGRQIRNQGEICVHVPLAGDIAETSANFLFSEQPTIQIVEAMEAGAGKTYIKTQEELAEALDESGFYRKLNEAAEGCAAMGGVYIKLAWDRDVSKYPIPVIVQTDRAIPEFKFGILSSVIFWQIMGESQEGKVYRLLERYEKGRISYTMYEGTSDRLGNLISLDALEETKGLVDIITNIDEVLAVYVPNILPNRLDRNSYHGRSDFSGIEGILDSLDEMYSAWAREISIAMGRIHVPESFISKNGSSKRFSFDQSVYVRLDIDPIVEGGGITATQFAIRANEFEKSCLNFIERAITAAGYSPQSFGLNIQGRAESGTALSMRERKSFATKNKKQNYWGPAIKKLVHLFMIINNNELDGKMDLDVKLNVAFKDGITNDSNELASSVKMISDAIAASTYTKVKMLHPDWSEKQIKSEVEAILEENSLGPQPNPDEPLDLDQMKNKNNQEGKKDETVGDEGNVD